MNAASGVSAIFRPLRHAPAYKALSAEIERQILGGALKPGDALPTEQELAERFAVNRSTVREAIRQLEQEGLLVRVANRRLQVALPGLYDLAPRAARALLLQQVTFRELWEVAVTLEPLAARHAAQRATDADLDELARNVEATDTAVRENRSFTSLDIAFHALVARASHNRVLILAREPVSLLYGPTLDLLRPRLPQTGPRNLDAHRRILDALRRRDADDAANWTRKHLIDFQRGYRVAALDTEEPVRWPEASLEAGSPHDPMETIRPTKELHP
jgi:DNA-binding FadR family transcriptional regulator